MRLPSLLLALIAVACTPTAALAQKTMPNLAVGAPVLAAAEKAAGATTTAPKSIADYNTRYLALPGLVAAALEKARAAVVAPVPVSTCLAGFDAVYYAKANPDVAAVYGANVRAHYDQYGKVEGRLGCEGAKPWRGDPSKPAEYAQLPACALTVSDAWVPAGSTQARVRFKLTRYGDGTPCERSYSVSGYAVNSDTRAKGFPGVNLGELSQVWQVQEAMTLPSQGSTGELIVNVRPGWSKGGFHVSLRTVEYNPIARAELDVLVGGERPAGASYNPEALVLPAATPYPADLGKPTYDSDLLGDLAANGYSFWNMGGLNGMIGAFTTPDTKTASGKLTNNYPIITDADGVRVRALVLRDHRLDPVEGKALYSSPMISRKLGNGDYGYRMTVQTLPKPMKGTDAATWGVRSAGGWPPEFDTHEGFMGGDSRVFQTVHMQNGYTTSFTPMVNLLGKHEWLEEFGRQTYRLWIDKVLVVERPNYLAGEVLDTTQSIEGPGGAGGAADATQPYDGLSLLLYRQAWWQR